jgi:hypothetical protein
MVSVDTPSRDTIPLRKTSLKKGIINSSTDVISLFGRIEQERVGAVGAGAVSHAGFTKMTRPLEAPAIALKHYLKRH